MNRSAVQVTQTAEGVSYSIRKSFYTSTTYRNCSYNVEKRDWDYPGFAVSIFAVKEFDEVYSRWFMCTHKII